jgi:hypothetical protein
MSVAAEQDGDMHNLSERLFVRTKPGTRAKLRFLAALRREAMGAVLADLVNEAIAQLHREQAAFLEELEEPR